LLKYIETADTRRLTYEQGDDVAGGERYLIRKEFLSFLLRTGFLTLGQGYLTRELTPTQRVVMKDLCEFGIFYQHRDSSKSFYPTRLAISLCSGKTVLPTGQEAAQVEAEGFIILESNYRLYAYTTAPLKLALLSLFVKMLYRLPNMAVGIITRESVRAALLNGISAEQIISFIQSNVHPQAKKSEIAVPETVMDQIRLWEAERNRVSYQRGILYDSFSTLELFNMTVKYAKDNSVFMYSNEEKRCLMVTEQGYEIIKLFLKKRLALNP